MDAVLAIWLEASLQVHDFVDPEIWHDNLSAMRDVYLPLSNTWVYVEEGEIAGFISLAEGFVGALFVAPEAQRQGVGSALLTLAHAFSPTLTLNVYKENIPAVNFYKAQGFSVVAEQIDEVTGHPEYAMRCHKDTGKQKA